jgi:hypothetical protein
MTTTKDTPQPQQPPAEPPPPPKKLPYERPVLRRLGSVNDRTKHNMVGSVSDGVRTKPQG